MKYPLLNDLGVHRWVDREPSYSDWLAWVLERLGTVAVFRILGLELPFNPEDAGNCYVRRESQLDERYLDLLICFDNRPDYAIGVEVKKYDSQYAKQDDYLRSLRDCYVNPPCILIAIPEKIDESQLCGFTLRPWRNVALALREEIAEYAKKNGEENRIVTAMMLGFVAAVEQNILGFGPAAPRRVSRHEPTLVPPDLVTYLGGDE
jgi:hypothetical protein